LVNDGNVTLALAKQGETVRLFASFCAVL